MNANFENENRGRTAMLVRSVWFGCFAFVAAFLGAVYLTVQFAGDAANEISTIRELQLVEFEVQRVAQNAIAAQQRLVRSDVLFLETKKAEEDRNLDRLLTLKLGREPFSFFGIIDSDADLVYASTQFAISQQKDKKRDTQRLINASLDLVQDAYAKFDSMKAPAQNGFVIPSHLLYDDSAMTVFGFRYLENKLHLIVVQPVLARTSYLRTDTPHPFVSIAAIPIPNLYFSQTAAKIGMRDLMPFQTRTPSNDKTFLALPNAQLPAAAQLEWDATSPKLTILNDALPYLILLSLIILASTVLVALKFSSVLNAFGLVNRKNSFMARHCGLTSLANRAKFDEMISEAMQGAPQNPFTLLTLDLDKFKPLNDTYGHDAGDLILVNVAKRFQEAVGEYGTVARVGGDEFMIILKENFGREITSQLTQELIELAVWPIPTPYGEMSVGCSIGIANAPKDGRNAPDLMRRADEAMYHSKRQGGNRATFAEDRITPNDIEVDFQTA